MEAIEIRGLGRRLREFLRPFDDCFRRSEPREHLWTYVGGQVSRLQRKSIEPMALQAGTPPRTLQYFLSSVPWDGPRMRDRQQWIVARDHADPRAVGIVDETGNPKKGRHTAGVRRQWCGNTGKVDNCVVAVHVAYAAGDFQCLLDSDLYLPREWAEDPVRRKEARIPEEVVFRTKPQIALDQIRRALANGIRVRAWTFDELYGRNADFLDGVEALGQDYVGEVPSDFRGWVREPPVLLRPTAEDRRRAGRPRPVPRLSRKAAPAREVRNLLRHSPVFTQQPWQPFRIQDGEKGPVVWEVKQAPFYRPKGPQGLPGPLQGLLVARNVLDRQEIKYFLCNRQLGAEGRRVEEALGTGFSRWPIERALEIGKRELGMDHFEVRSWTAIHRHFYISQLSQLFCARIHQELREKNAIGSLPDGRTGPRSDSHMPGSPSLAAPSPTPCL